MVFGQAVPLRNVCHRLGKEIPAYQHIPLPFRQSPHETPNALPQLFGLVCRLCVCPAAKAFPKLVQDEGNLAAAPLFRISRMETVKGKIAGNLRQKMQCLLSMV